MVMVARSEACPNPARVKCFGGAPLRDVEANRLAVVGICRVKRGLLGVVDNIQTQNRGFTIPFDAKDCKVGQDQFEAAVDVHRRGFAIQGGLRKSADAACFLVFKVRVLHCDVQAFELVFDLSDAGLYAGSRREFDLLHGRHIVNRGAGGFGYNLRRGDGLFRGGFG